MNHIIDEKHKSNNFILKILEMIILASEVYDQVNAIITSFTKNAILINMKPRIFSVPKYLSPGTLLGR